MDRVGREKDLLLEELGGGKRKLDETRSLQCLQRMCISKIILV